MLFLLSFILNIADKKRSITYTPTPTQTQWYTPIILSSEEILYRHIRKFCLRNGADLNSI
jgi:hypothetical protein